MFKYFAVACALSYVAHACFGLYRYHSKLVDEGWQIEKHEAPSVYWLSIFVILLFLVLACCIRWVILYLRGKKSGQLNITVKNKIYISVAAAITVFAMPYVLVLLWMGGNTVNGKIDLWRYHPTQEFKVTDWKRPNLKYRYAVLDHVVNIIVEKEMSKDALEQLLGKPDRIEKDGSWQYDTEKPGWQFMGWSGGGLNVIFDQDEKVSKASNNTWVD